MTQQIDHIYDQIAVLNGVWPTSMNIIKAAEELGEVSGAYLKLHGRKPRKGVDPARLKENLYDEVGDLLVTVLAITHSLGMGSTQLLECAQYGVDRWREATVNAEYDELNQAPE